MWSREARALSYTAAGAGSELSQAGTWGTTEERQPLALGGAGSLSIGKTALNRAKLPLPE